MFYDILDEKRIEILPLFQPLKDRFYLAGGTGLALQIGHRDSVDFDFFMQEHFNTFTVYTELLELFESRKLVKTLEEKDSLNVIVDNTIKLSLLRYPYALLNSCIDEKYMRIASIEDIGCMKLSTISGRAIEKDYIDLYFILKQIPLSTLLEKAKQKMPDLDRNLVLKSLVYFDDMTSERIIFKHDSEVQFSEVKKFLENQVTSLSSQV